MIQNLNQQQLLVSKVTLHTDGLMDTPIALRMALTVAGDTIAIALWRQADAPERSAGSIGCVHPLW